MKLGKEIVRTCLAGVAVHFALVAACSGVDTEPVLRLAGGPDSGSLPGASSGTGSDGSTPARQPQSDAGRPPSLLLPVAEAEAAESGSRLKARWYVGADGSRQFLNWFDSEVQAECYFARGRDGALRCLPSPLGESVLSTALYADEECSSRVAAFSAASCGSAQPNVVVIQDQAGTDACAQTPYRYHRVGAEVPAGEIYTLQGTACTVSPRDPARTYRLVGAEIPAAGFVAGEIVVDG